MGTDLLGVDYMMNTIDPAAREQAELERIRGEYRRRSREVPAGLYGWEHPVNQFWYFNLYREVLAALRRTGMFPLAGRDILDVGCGDGLWLLAFLNWGAHAGRIHGIDLSPERVSNARLRLPEIDLRSGDAGRLPWDDRTFDIVSEFAVFTSMLDSELKQRAASEMLRVLKPGGLILWYDFFLDNPSNPNVRGVRAAEVRSLFPNCRVHLRRVTLAPPIARRVVPVSWPAAAILNACPFLRTHYFGAITPTEALP